MNPIVTIAVVIMLAFDLYACAGLILGAMRNRKTDKNLAYIEQYAAEHKITKQEAINILY